MAFFFVAWASARASRRWFDEIQTGMAWSVDLGIHRRAIIGAHGLKPMLRAPSVPTPDGSALLLTTASGNRVRSPRMAIGNGMGMMRKRRSARADAPQNSEKHSLLKCSVGASVRHTFVGPTRATSQELLRATPECRVRQVLTLCSRNRNAPTAVLKAIWDWREGFEAWEDPKTQITSVTLTTLFAHWHTSASHGIEMQT